MTSPALFLLGTLGVGGSERKFVRIANALAAQGRRVHLAWLGGPESLRGEIGAGVGACSLERRGKYSLSALSRLARLIGELRPAAVVNVNFYPMTYSLPARMMARQPTRLMASINTTDLPGTRESRFMRLYAPMLRRMDTVVFGAHAQARQWRARFGIEAGRSRVVHNGVDAQRFVPPDRAGRAAARAELHLPEAVPVAICVAQLRPEKAHDLLLESFARTGRGDARLLLVGDGAARSALETQAARLRIADRVVFAGEVADVRAWLAAADVFVLASVAVETFSNAALEAAACALPVVMTDIGGARELVEDGGTGYVVAPHDAAALAASLGRLLDDPVRAQAMGEAGRRRILASFSFARMLEDWVDVIWAPAPDGAAELAA